MPPITTDAFKLFLQSSDYRKLNTKLAVNCVLYEGITDFESLADFDKESLKIFSKNYTQDFPAPDAGVEAEPALKGANISTITGVRLLTDSNAVKYYKLVGRTPDPVNMSYKNVLSKFQVDYDHFEKLKKQDATTVPMVKESDAKKKIINWTPVFEDCMSRTFGLQGPLAYVLRKEAAVPSEMDDPLNSNEYFGESGGLIEEMTARIPLTGSLYKSDNKTVYLHIDKACNRT